MRTSASMLVVTGVLVLLGGLAACSDDDESNSGGSGGAATGGTGGGETGGSGGGETGGTGGGETGGSGGGETGGSGGGETGGTGGGETGGTGGGETGGTGGGASGLACKEACENLASANCGQEPDVAGCTAECHADMGAHLTECGTEANALVDCVATSEVSCDGEEPNPESCYEQATDYEVCIVCFPATTDDECDVCIKQNCCTELKGITGDYNPTTEDAYMDCNENHCVDECGSG